MKFDIEKEKKSFDLFYHEIKNILDISENDAFEIWLARARIAQEKEQEFIISEMSKTDEFILVPKIPTTEMCDAGCDAFSYKIDCFEVERIYKAMIKNIQNITYNDYYSIYNDGNQTVDLKTIEQLGENYEFGDIVEIEKIQFIELKPVLLYGGLNKDMTKFIIGTKEQIQNMIQKESENN